MGRNREKKYWWRDGRKETEGKKQRERDRRGDIEEKVREGEIRWKKLMACRQR